MMKQINSFVFLFLISNFVFSQTTNTIVSGIVGGNWVTDTVTVTGDIQVPGNDSLVIDPGTVVLFTGHYRFEVKGFIHARGTESESILFTIADTTGFSDTLSALGGWHGFVYDHMPMTADSSIFEYCRFEYGKAFSADTFGQYGGAFRVFDFGRISFRNCTFFSNSSIRWGGAIYLRNSDLSFDHCEFVSNKCGLALFPWGYGGGICSVSSEPVVQHCYFQGNNATGFGGGASFEYSDPFVRFNTFNDNFGGLAGGFGYLRSSPTRIVSNNLVHGNTARFFGGGVACIRSSTTFANNTIVQNTSSYGGGFYCNDSAVPVLYNNILYGNLGFGHEVYIWDVRSAPSFHYCVVEGDTSDFEGSGSHEGFLGNFTNNLDADPQFRASGQFPYALLASSPCVDAGTPDTSGLSLPLADMEGMNRIWNNRVDIGAFEWNPGQGVSHLHKPVKLLKAYPNPAFQYIFFEILSERMGMAEVNIYNFSGEFIMKLPYIMLVPGKNNIQWDLIDFSGNRIPPGAYIATYREEAITIMIHR